MTNYIQRIYHKLLRVGLPPDAKFKEKLKIELSNQFIIFGLTCVLLHNVVNLLLLRSLVDFYLTMVWFWVLAPSLVLNIIHKPKLARFNLAIGGVLAVFILHLLFGSGLKLEPMYILFLVVGTMFFEFSTMVKFAIFTVTLFLIAAITTAYVEPVFQEYVKPSGSFTRFIFSVTMITSLIGKLVLENRRYNKVIGNQNEYLNKYNQQLKSFNYIVSHDLKEPLRNIVGFSQLAIRNYDKGQKRNEEYLNFVIRSTKQLNKLVDDLKDFTSSEERDLSQETFRIEELVDEIRYSSSEFINGKNAEIVCQSFPPIVSSRLALTIILRNLIENGIKYNDKEKPQILIEGQVKKKYAEIRVIDNGIGIKEKHFEEIFEMFKRLNADHQKGSGLGLNIAKNLVERLDGEIFVAESTLYEGTIFQINFPVNRIEVEPITQKERFPEKV